MTDTNTSGAEVDRDIGGRIVREAWVRWALTQPNPKPSWLVPYDELSEPDKEADRQIFEACVAALIERENDRDVDSVALDVARRFTPNDDPQRRARLQCAVIDAINKDRVPLGYDEENHATAMVMVVEVLGLDLPCEQDQIIGEIKSLIKRNAELEAERDALRKACVAVLDSSPKNICHRNAKEREAYKTMRRALGWPEGRHGH